MATYTLKAYSGAYPSITNRLEAACAYATSPLAIVASEIESGTHNVRTWSFDGLPRNNYRWYLWEIDGGGSIVNVLADFDVVPGELDGELVRDDEQIKVGSTTGLVAGDSSFVFDGTGGKKDYRGWTIVVDECTGRDIMVEGLDFSWDKISGTFQLLQSGDLFASGQWYNIHFNSQLNEQVSSYPTVTDFTIRLSQPTVSDDILLSDFGNKIISEPQAVYVEYNLPDINTIVDGRKCMIEMSSSSAVCAKLVPMAGQNISWLNGNLYFCPSESFSIYAFTRSGIKEWRIDDADGNFKIIGEEVGEDQISANVVNKHLLDGSVESTTKYARFYNEYILNLPVSQVVAYADWLTGNNKYYYSLDNGSGQFHFADRRGVFERNNSGGKAGDYQTEIIGPHKHFIAKTIVGSVVNNLDYTQTLVSRRDNGETNAYILSGEVADADVGLTNDGGGTENVPNNYLINKYVRI